MIDLMDGKTSPTALPHGIWTLGLLHSFRLERAGQVIQRFQRRLQDSLLAYLALQPTRAHGRDEIARLFWPDKPVSVAQRRLSHVLFFLNKELKELGLPEGTIQADYYTLQLAPGIGTDVQQLDSLLARAARDADPAERQRLMVSARQLYGDGLLPLIGLPWVVAERQRLADRMAAALRSTATEADRDTEVPPYGPRPSAMEEPAVVALSVSPMSGSTPVMAPAGPAVRNRELGRQDEDRLRQFSDLTAWLERIEPHLSGPDHASWVEQLDQRDTEIRLAMDWASSEQGARSDAELALRLLAALWRYWYLRAMVDLGRQYVRQVLVARPAQESRIYAQAVYAAGSLALCASDHDQARQWFDEALQLSLRLGDERLQSRCLASLGAVAYQEGDLARARGLLAEGAATFRESGDQTTLAGVLHNAALVEIDAGDFGRAEELLREYMQLGRRLGDKTITANGLMTLGTILGQSGALERVEPLVAEAQQLFEAQGHLPGLALCHRYRAYIASERDQFEIARIHLESSLSLCRALKDLAGIGESLRQLAELLEKQGQVIEALALYREALQFLDAHR
ncbi:MAG TPA: hypothetical protein PLZ56_01675 [Anaerolineae bacterium]|nr:hypothetical protein [Anaerolineae bacterium]